MGKWLRRLVLGAGALVAAAAFALCATLVVAGLLYRDPARELTPAGLPRGASAYLTMRDGTRIAVTIWLPSDLRPGQRVPALVKGTPYWRGGALTFLGKALTRARRAVSCRRARHRHPQRQRGYAVIAVDTRGTGASFGHQDILLDQPEVRGLRRHHRLVRPSALVERPRRRLRLLLSRHARGQHGVAGSSGAEGDRAELRLHRPLPDHPSGRRLQRDLPEEVGRRRPRRSTAANRRAPASAAGWSPGPCPVDADRDGALLRAAIAEHARNYDVFACAQHAPWRDSPLCTSGKTVTQVSELSRRDAVRAIEHPDVRDRRLVRCDLAGRSSPALSRASRTASRW